MKGFKVFLCILSLMIFGVLSDDDDDSITVGFSEDGQTTFKMDKKTKDRMFIICVFVYFYFVYKYFNGYYRGCIYCC